MILVSPVGRHYPRRDYTRSRTQCGSTGSLTLTASPGRTGPPAMTTPMTPQCASPSTPSAVSSVICDAALLEKVCAELTLTAMTCACMFTTD